MTVLPNELTEVEKPFVEQLRGLGWEHVQGDIGVPDLTGRSSFREVLLKQRLRAAMRRINVGEDGEPWIDDARIEHAIGQFDRIAAPHLMEANQQATELLLRARSWKAMPAMPPRRTAPRTSSTSTTPSATTSWSSTSSASIRPGQAATGTSSSRTSCCS